MNFVRLLQNSAAPGPPFHLRYRSRPNDTKRPVRMSSFLYVAGQWPGLLPHFHSANTPMQAGRTTEVWVDFRFPSVRFQWYALHLKILQLRAGPGIYCTCLRIWDQLLRLRKDLIAFLF